MTDNRFTEAAEKWLKKRFPEYQKDTSVMHVDVEVYLTGAEHGYAEGKAERDQLKAAIESWKREEQDWQDDLKELRTRLEVYKDAMKDKDNAYSLMCEACEIFRTRLSECEAALKWYCNESINHHNYHALMGTDLISRARDYFAKHSSDGGKEGV
jgi:chromosome segregation ATPase